MISSQTVSAITIWMMEIQTGVHFIYHFFQFLLSLTVIPWGWQNGLSSPGYQQLCSFFLLYTGASYHWSLLIVHNAKAGASHSQLTNSAALISRHKDFPARDTIVSQFLCQNRSLVSSEEAKWPGSTMNYRIWQDLQDPRFDLFFPFLWNPVVPWELSW